MAEGSPFVHSLRLNKKEKQLERSFNALQYTQETKKWEQFTITQNKGKKKNVHQKKTKTMKIYIFKKNTSAVWKCIGGQKDGHIKTATPGKPTLAFFWQIRAWVSIRSAANIRPHEAHGTRSS